MDSMDQSYYKIPRHDSGFDVYKLLDNCEKEANSNSISKQLKKKWIAGYMPSTLPEVFRSDIAIKRYGNIYSPEHVSAYESEYILWLKDKRNPMNMKLLHPRGYSKLIDATCTIIQKVKDTKNQSKPNEKYPELLISDAWKALKDHVILANGLEQIDAARGNCENNKHVIRFDIRQFYESFYLHILAWVNHNDRNNAKIAWFLERDKYWANPVEQAVLNLQYRESIGLPIGSSLIRELAESFLICLDAQIIERIKKEKGLLEKFKLIRSHDNYDVICSTSESCSRCAIVIVYLLREYGFTVNYEPNFTQPSAHEVISLTSLLSKSLSVSLDRLLEYKDSIDYHKMLSYFVQVLKTNGFLKLKYKDFFSNFLLEHPASISDVLSLEMDGDCRNMIMSILIDNIQNYVYQGVTCQFIYILENIRLHFNSDYYNAVMGIINKFKVIENHLLVSSYINVLEEIYSPKSVTHCDTAPSTNSDLITVIIKSDTQKETPLSFKSDFNVATIKSNISYEPNTLLSQKELRFNGKLLQNESVLASCGVKNGSTLYFKIVTRDEAFLDSVFNKLNTLIPDRYLIDLKGLEHKKIKKITVPANMKDLKCLKLVVDALRYQIEAKLKEKVKYTEKGEKWIVEMENGSPHEIKFEADDNCEKLLEKLADSLK
eukprot:NODE_62_length_25126_cov_0.447277.p3 type:complete len:659 gc:universal NODE_62_length_25126_cov_0.447277:15982-14006(-)